MLTDIQYFRFLISKMFFFSGRDIFFQSYDNLVDNNDSTYPHCKYQTFSIREVSLNHLAEIHNHYFYLFSYTKLR